MSRKQDQFKTSLTVYELLIITLQQFCNIAANKVRLEISTNDMAKLNSLAPVFMNAYALSKAKSSATPAARITTGDAREKLTTFLRKFVKKYFYENQLATANDILTAGLELHGSRHSPYETPTDLPILVNAPEAGNVIKLVYTSYLTQLKRKPDGVMEVRIRYWLGKNPPENPNDWHLFKDVKVNPAYFRFLKSQVGTPIVFAACYVGTNGEEGAYSNKVSTAIP